MMMQGKAVWDGRRLLLRLILVTVLLGCSAAVLAQRTQGTISGRVVSTDGQPIRHARVELMTIGDAQKMMASRREIYTDESGKFYADKLDPAPYSLTASAPGYVVVPQAQARAQAGRTEQYTHLGESVTIRMQRGGVITGRVLTASGEPVVGIALETSRLRDERGNPTTDAMTKEALGLGNKTDDRGVYRIYGLAPGTYLVSVGAGMLEGAFQPTPFAGRARIYHPSGTRDTATEVVVQSGAEVSSIDIRYRVERGAALTGKILGMSRGGADLASLATSTAYVMLTKAGTDTVMGTTAVMPIGDNLSYSFYGLSGGDYEVMAMRPDMNQDNFMLALPRRVTIKNSDVTGVDLQMAKMASISGSVSLEKLLPAATAQSCKSSRDSFVEEMVLTTKASESEPKAEMLRTVLGLAPDTTPNEQGAFTLHSLLAGRYFLTPRLPDDHWYVKSVVLTSVPVANAVARNAGRNGINVKAGEKITGLKVTLAQGAAGVKGKLTATGTLPSNVRIHLLPAEPEARDEVLRFAEAEVAADGAFSFAHLAPGKYLLLARAIPESEPPGKPVIPVAWDVAARAKLRKEAEAEATTMELKTCQRATDVTLRWSR